MIKDIREINFPKYATLSTATATFNDMGDKTISTQVKIDGSIVPDFSYEWEIEFKGERYIHPLRKPQASKGNESINSIIDLTFYHKGIYELKRYHFVEMASTESGTPIADKYIAPLGLNLGDFCEAFNKVLNYYFSGAIVLDLNPDWEYANERVFVEISYSYLWDVLQKIHESYDVRWNIEYHDGVYVIKVGYPSNDVSHVFQYGFEGGLLRVERQVQDANIRNSLLGRGGSKNLPTYYFKTAPEGSTYPSDPDAIPELANIYFSELRGKTFRDYVKGWKARHYGGTPMSEPTDAYTRGYTDTKFSPIEYVEDKESIAKYGLLQGGLDNNEDIYPSIQNVSKEGIGLINEVVAVEPILSDDFDNAVNNDSIVTNVDSATKTVLLSAGYVALTYSVRQTSTFVVPQGETATLTWEPVLTTRYEEAFAHIVQQDSNVRVYDTQSNAEVSSINIPSGTYYYVYEVKLRNTANYDIAATIGAESVKLLMGSSSESWKPTFDVWIKNVWDTQKDANESDVQYVNRVWSPILGSRGEEASIGFVSGWLAVSDYEFRIAQNGIAYDTTKSFNGVPSEWRITLIKTDAEYEATGKYIPSANTNGQAVAGDLFIFTGIEMPQAYVEFAEERLDLYKEDALLEVADIKPTWVVAIDKVRVNNLRDNENETLISQINIGSQIHLSDKRFIEGAYIDLYIQSITYNWQGNTILPDVEVVLSDKVVAVKSPISQIQGDVEVIKSQLSGVSNLQQLIRKIGDSLYLRKDGFSDVSKSKTDFQNTIQGYGFKQGLVGGAGWGIYRNEQGQTIAEFDKILARNELQVNNLVINQVSHIGGSFICSPASIECNGVVEHSDGYECFFDQREGTISNLFAVGDIAYSSVWDAEGNQTKYYKRVVDRITDNSIVLSKTNKDGEGIPAIRDVIVQMGNISNVDRQGIIIITSNPIPTFAQYVGVNSFVLPAPTTQFKPNENILTGQVHFQAGSTGAKNLIDLPEIIEEAMGDIDFDSMEFGKYNLLRNSGFTGDYLSKQLDPSADISNDSQLFSPSLEHWTAANATAQESDTSESGVEVVLAGGSLSQTLKSKVIRRENYVISFRAKGTSLTVSVAGVERTIALTNEYTRYVEKIVASSTDNVFAITNADCTICEIQFERGSVVSAWGYSMWDNTSELAYYQALRYLSGALKDGSTTINGGLILSNILALGNYLNGNMTSVTAGVSGVYNDADDVAFWGGGSIEQAILTVAKFRDNPQYQPTEAEWAQMAKFAVTHGGDVFMRGYIHALGGYFRGTVDIADQKILLNADGSGHFANGNVRWDSAGRVQKSAPDSVIWTSVSAYDSGVIDYHKGSYLILSYNSFAENIISEFTLATPAFDNFSILIRNGYYDGGTERAVLLGNFKATKNGITETATALTVSVGEDTANITAELVYQSDGFWHLQSEDYGIGTNGVMYVGDAKSESFFNGYFTNVDDEGNTLNFRVIDGRLKLLS